LGIAAATSQIFYLSARIAFSSYLSELDPDNALRLLQAASFTYPIALWPRASLKG